MQIINFQYLLQITLYAVILGSSLGAVYDVVRIARMAYGATTVHCPGMGFLERIPSAGKNGIFLHGKRAADWIFVFISDILYAGVLTASVILFAYHFNSGRLRWFLLVGVAVGFFVYYFTLGRLVIFFSGYIVGILRRFIGFILYLVTEPIILFASLIRIHFFTPLKKYIQYKYGIYKTEKIRKNLIRIVKL